MNDVQLDQNKMLRMLDRVTLLENVSTASILKKYKLPSVNQLAAEIKMIAAWKSTHVEHYPLQLEQNNPGREDMGRIVRASTTKLWKDDAKSKAAKVSLAEILQNCGTMPLLLLKMQLP